MSKTNKYGVIKPIGIVSKKLSATYRSRGGVTATLRATRSDKGKKRQ